MTVRKAPSRTPTGLKAAGRSLWQSVVGDFDLDRHEELLLLQACRCADRLDQMARALDQAPLTVTNARGDEVPHPLLTESRQQSLTLARLLASLRLPSGENEQVTRPQRRGAARASYGIRGAV